MGTPPGGGVKNHARSALSVQLLLADENFKKDVLDCYTVWIISSSLDYNQTSHDWFWRTERKACRGLTGRQWVTRLQADPPPLRRQSFGDLAWWGEWVYWVRVSMHEFQLLFSQGLLWESPMSARLWYIAD